MAKVTISQLKTWFAAGLKPTQQQFWNLFDSFFHKDDSIPVHQIEGLQAEFDKYRLTSSEIPLLAVTGLSEALANAGGSNYIPLVTVQGDTLDRMDLADGTYISTGYLGDFLLVVANTTVNNVVTRVLQLQYSSTGLQSRRCWIDTDGTPIYGDWNAPYDRTQVYNKDEADARYVINLGPTVADNLAALLADQGGDFSGLNFEGADFSNVILNGANLTGANLTGVNWTGCMILDGGAIFTGAILSAPLINILFDLLDTYNTNCYYVTDTNGNHMYLDRATYWIEPVGYSHGAEFGLMPTYSNFIQFDYNGVNTFFPYDVPIDPYALNAEGVNYFGVLVGVVPPPPVEPPYVY
jgi:hypothetical protein